jgi:hypothetical protein
MYQSEVKNWVRHASSHLANAWSHLQYPRRGGVDYEYATRRQPLTLSPINSSFQT